MSIAIVILAAGKGTRMKSDLPKVLHPLAGKPLVKHVLDATTNLSGERVIVTGHGGERVAAALAEEAVSFVEQHEQLGTGHAVREALPAIGDADKVLILYGDVPLIQPATIEGLLAVVDQQTLALLTVDLDNPTGYGRIVRNALGDVTAIVEQKDASPEQLSISEVNTGIMAVSADHLKSWLPTLDNNNAQGEYYLTDLIAIARESGVSIETRNPDSPEEVEGVNDRVQLSRLERYLQKRIATELMADGNTLLDPNRFDCRGNLTTGVDNQIDINCVFEGDVSLGSGVQIGPNCHLKDCTVADNVVIKANSVIDGAQIASGADIGPFARLRPGTVLAEGSRVGNFVETKNTRVGVGSKINHLSYVGDAILGDKVNIGAGTITCNYDGVNKHRTEIGDGAFIGSNTALVAPVKVGKSATIGAGSTIAKPVADNNLGLTRAKQVEINGWKRPVKKND